MLEDDEVKTAALNRSLKSVMAEIPFISEITLHKNRRVDFWIAQHLKKSRKHFCLVISIGKLKNYNYLAAQMVELSHTISIKKANMKKQNKT